MRKAILASLGMMALLLALPAWAQQEESVAEAARKAREKKKEAAKAGKVFTNDNLPATPGRVSVVGPAAPTAAEKEGEKAGKGEEKKEDVKDEKYWRSRFAEARAKVGQAEKELDILQRELNLLQVQHYNDPNQAMREQFERRAINDQRKKIEDKQKEIQQLRQALADLEDDLRRAGGDPAWARE